MKEENTRRRFIKRLIIGLLSLEVIYIIFSLGKSRDTSNEDTNLFDAGSTNEFENNKTYPFHSKKFYLSRFSDGGLLAISTKCTHLGCTTNYNNVTQTFNCPCHSSKFTQNGEVMAPPATRALDYYKMEIKNNRVLVDLSTPIKRDSHSKSQLTYA